MLKVRLEFLAQVKRHSVGHYEAQARALGYRGPRLASVMAGFSDGMDAMIGHFAAAQLIEIVTAEAEMQETMKKEG